MCPVGKLEAFSFQAKSILAFGDRVTEAIDLALEEFEFCPGDVLVIASKLFSMQEKSAVLLESVIPSELAEQIASEAKMDPRFVQLVLNESDKIYGFVPKAVLSQTFAGINANAGIDMSNAPNGYALLLPKNLDECAKEIYDHLYNKYKFPIPVIITDSKTIPLRRGTSGQTISLYGMEPVIDDRGKNDLYNYRMQISTRAIADNIATVATILMGETNERTPFAVVRGAEYTTSTTANLKQAMMPEDQCLYFAPFIKAIKDRGEGSADD